MMGNRRPRRLPSKALLRPSCQRSEPRSPSTGKLSPSLGVSACESGGEMLGWKDELPPVIETVLIIRFALSIPSYSTRRSILCYLPQIQPRNSQNRNSPLLSHLISLPTCRIPCPTSLAKLPPLPVQHEHHE